MRIITVLAALCAAGAAQAQSVVTSGMCPGPVSIEVSGVTARGDYVILKGDGPGADVVPGGPCVGVRTGLSLLAWFGPFSADGGGMDSLRPTVPTPDAGLIQVLDLRTCGLSTPTSVCGGDCDPATEVELDGVCYYLDGSTGECDPGYTLAPQAVLEVIAGDFVGKDYKNEVSGNCCIWHRDQDVELQDWGMSADCNAPGPFSEGPIPGGAGCSDVLNMLDGQLTFCMSM